MPDQKIVSCWNSIGVWGRVQPRCALLKDIIHCRNCEKFVEAGREVLSKLPAHNLHTDWTTQIAEAKERRNTEQNSLLVFRIGASWFGLSCAVLDEVCAQRRIRSIPNVDSLVVKGLVNISGKVQLCFSLGQLFKIEKYTGTRERRKSLYDSLIVAVWNGRKYVFPVNEILGIYSYGNHALTPLESPKENPEARFFSGKLLIDTYTIHFLDAGSVFSEFDRDMSHHAG